MLSYLSKALLTISIILLSISSSAQVEVDLNGSHYSFTKNPSLSEVLEPIALQDDWYWPASTLFRNTATESEQMRSQVIEMLAEEGRTNDKHKSTYQSIINQLKNWQLADRVTISIDYEQARISAKHNPRFENGQYQLTLSKRPTYLFVFGAVETPVDITYQNNKCIEDVVSQIKLAKHADSSFVYLISPQGSVQKAPIAYWNQACILAIPGSSIYVPIQEDVLFTTQNQINHKVAQLAVNRIVLP